MVNDDEDDDEVRSVVQWNVLATLSVALSHRFELMTLRSDV